MKVKELMTTTPVTCSPLDDLTTAGVRMWDHDCGLLPVVEGNALVGTITDRDICLALAMRGSHASVVTVGSVMRDEGLVTCSLEDEIVDALSLMGRHQVRRLPVVSSGRFEGLLSISDLVLEARELAGADRYPTHNQVIGALQGICAHHHASVTAPLAGASSRAS